jgi:hypothetical protein
MKKQKKALLKKNQIKDQKNKTKIHYRIHEKTE